MGLRSIARAACAALLLFVAQAADAFQGPFASTTPVGPGGFVLDLDIRWPVVFMAHGAGGDKTSASFALGTYANDGSVTLSWTARSTATSPTPETLAGDVLALKAWVVDDFEAEAAVTVPVDPARFGIMGFSLGGYTSWSTGLLSTEFATIVPANWGFHFFPESTTLNGSIERRTSGPLAALMPTPYDAAGLQAAVDAVFAPALAAFATCTSR